MELLIGLMIMGLLFCSLVPLQSKQVDQHQQQLIADTLTQAVHYAKIQSVLQNKTLYLRPTSEDSNWSKGIILVSEPTPLSSEYHKDTMRYCWTWKAPLISVFWHGFQSKNYVQFTSDIAHSATNGYFTVQAKHSNTVIKIIINRYGSTRQVFI